jgi:peptide deformylase
MALRPIRILGEPGDEVLRRPGEAIDCIDGSVQRLIDDMIETMRYAPGVGLAAPQVGVSLRLVVIETPEVPAFALINPEVVHNSGRRWLDEGCLSIPGYRGDLFRSIKVTVSGLDRRWRRVRVRAADDLLAQALEHEIDHTNGLLYVDLLSGPEHLHRTDRDEPEAADEAETLDRRGDEAADRAELRRRRGRAPRFYVARARMRTKPHTR